MAVVAVTEEKEGLGSTINDQYARTYTRQFLIWCDAYDGPAYVRNHVTPPGASSPLQPGVSYDIVGSEIDTGALLLDLDVQCVDQIKARPDTDAPINGLVYRATAKYGPWNPLEHTSDGDPTNQPWELSVDGVQSEEVVKGDIFGSPILNTAGDAFDPPLMRDRARCVFRVSGNVSTPAFATLMGYANQVNDADWFSLWPARTVKVMPPKFIRKWSQFLGAVLYWTIEFSFEYNPDEWDAHILNCGYKQLVTSGGTTTQQLILDPSTGNTLSSPAMLDISGHQIMPPFDLDSTADPSSDDDIGPGDADTEPTASGTSSPVVVLTFEVYNKLDFDTAFSFFPSDLFG